MNSLIIMYLTLYLMIFNILFECIYSSKHKFPDKILCQAVALDSAGGLSTDCGIKSSLHALEYTVQLFVMRRLQDVGQYKIKMLLSFRILLMFV